MNRDETEDIAEILRSDRPQRAMRKAVREALLRHKLLGQPIVVSRDGEVVWIPPEEIEVPPEEGEG